MTGVIIACAGVSSSLTLQYENILFVLEPTDISVGLRNKRVTVSDFPDGRIEISYKGVVLPYRIFDKHQRVSQATMVENKFLGGVLEFIRTKQLEEPLPKRKARGVRNPGQLPSIFKVG